MNAPERIYLQVEGEEWDALPKEVELLDVTWCSDRIHKSDPEYLRSDLCARWVSVKQRLPETATLTMVRVMQTPTNLDNVGVPVMDFDSYKDGHWSFWGKRITHWLDSAPPIPKEGE